MEEKKSVLAGRLAPEASGYESAEVCAGRKRRLLGETPRVKLPVGAFLKAAKALVSQVCEAAL